MTESIGSSSGSGIEGNGNGSGEQIVDLSLNKLIKRSLNQFESIKSSDSMNSIPTQTLINSTITDLQLSLKLIDYLSILSKNELLEDLLTNYLNCLLIHYYLANLYLFKFIKPNNPSSSSTSTSSNDPSSSLKERIKNLLIAKQHFNSYISLINQYEIIPPSKLSSFQGPINPAFNSTSTSSTSTTLSTSSSNNGQRIIMDASRKRELKIAQYKLEKEILGTLEELRKRRSNKKPSTSSTSTSSNNYNDNENDFPAINYDSNSEDEDDEDDYTRPLLLSLISLNYLLSHSELNSIEQELELLNYQVNLQSSQQQSSASSNASSSASGSGSNVGGGRNEGFRERQRDGTTDIDELNWKVEELGFGKGSGPLLDSNGRVLRSFTILPSTSASSASPLSTRLRLQSEIFRPSHSLPTMTIDEYLQHEKDSGRILQGGGPNGSEALEQEREGERGDKEADEDTERGYRREEDGLRKLRGEDDWKDTHRKGEGNMHNRG